jgi:hypothetical protein
MKPAYRGLAVLILQCLIALSVFGKYTLDRDRLPRVWAKAAPVDPNLPIRGRYLSLRLEVDTTPIPGPSQSFGNAGHLSIRDGRLFVDRDGAPAGSSTLVFIMRLRDQWTLMKPVAFFLPEHAADPSRLPAGKELWVEVSVPRKGPPRPIRLEVR